MGIYDRDYYRREGPSYLGSFLERGLVCKWLIGINVVFFIVQMVTRVAVHGHSSAGYVDGAFTEWLILSPEAVLHHGQVWRLLTYAFLHSTDGLPTHILFNMLFLWWFGTDVEDLYGPREFLGIYLLSAIAGGVLYVLTSLPGLSGDTPSALGASGAVTAIMVLCAIHYPMRTIYLMWFIPMPLWLFVVGAVGFDAYQLFTAMHTGIAVACHLGGAAFAYGYYKLNLRVTNFLPTSLGDWKKQHRSSPRLRVYREDEEDGAQKPQPVSVASSFSNPPSSSLLDDEQLEAKMDDVLEKISRVGKDNLTDSDKEVLRRASELLKKRRS